MSVTKIHQHITFYIKEIINDKERDDFKKEYLFKKERETSGHVLMSNGCVACLNTFHLIEDSLLFFFFFFYLIDYE